MDDSVQVQGPDGQQYSFPSGTDKNAAIAYFKKKGIGGAPATSQNQSSGSPQAQPSGATADTSSPVTSTVKSFASGVGTGLKSLVSMPGQIYHAFADDPQTPEEKQLMGGPYSSLILGTKRLLLDPQVSEYDKAKQEAQTGNTSESMGHSIAAGVPLFGPLAAHLGEEGGQDPAKAIGEGLTYLAAPKVAGKVIGAAPKAIPAIGNLLRDLTDPAQRVTNMGRTDALTQISNARQNFADHVGKVINGINAADYQQSGGTRAVSVAPVVSKIANIDQTFKATPDTMPLYWEARQSLLDSNAPDSKMFMKEVHDLKQKVGENFADSPDGSKDRAATSQLLNSVDDVMAKRAEELGQTKQFDYYRTKWRTLKTMESPRGILGQLDNTGDSAGPASIDPRAGKKFFDILRDPHNTAAVNDAVADLSQFGLNKNFVSDLSGKYGPMHDYLKAQDITLMNQNRRPSLTKAVIVGAKRGYAKVGAANALPNFDIPPAGSGPKVDYVGDGTAPDINPLPPKQSITPAGNGKGSTAAMAQQATDAAMNKTRAPEYGGPNPQAQTATETAPSYDPQEIVNALSGKKGLGYDKAEAVRRAKLAAAAEPGDFNAALDYAIRGGPAKAQAVKAAKAQASDPGIPKADWNPLTPETNAGKPRNISMADRIQSIKDEAAAARKRRQN